MTVQRPRKNRVTPFGVLERSDVRGNIMGNRGDLHGPDGEIVRAWKIKAWIACTTFGKDGYRVTFDRPGWYAPLFALDEATMLAAATALAHSAGATPSTASKPRGPKRTTFLAGMHYRGSRLMPYSTRSGFIRTVVGALTKPGWPISPKGSW